MHNQSKSKTGVRKFKKKLNAPLLVDTMIGYNIKYNAIIKKLVFFLYRNWLFEEKKHSSWNIVPCYRFVSDLLKQFQNV